MFKIEPSKLAGCYKFSPKIIADVRGRFVKIFHEPSYAALGLETNFAEEYYSVSHNNVIRGLHFQVPPMDHVKIVYCLEGHALDVVLDLRVGSPTYGQFELFELNSNNSSSIYIPKGMAHGFCALSENTIHRRMMLGYCGIPWGFRGRQRMLLCQRATKASRHLHNLKVLSVMSETSLTTGKQRVALVTGATGYIGSNLAKRLVTEGWDVHVVVRTNTRLDALDPILPQITVQRHDGSTRGMIQLVGDARPDVVLHLASLFLAQHRPEDVEALISSNLLFSTQLAEAMAANQVKHLINTSTSWQHYENAEYNPVNLYAATKQAFEDILAYYIDACGLRVVTLALFDTYGPNDPRPKLISLLWKTALNQEALAMSPGEQLIDLVHIEDVMDAFLHSADLVIAQHEGHMRYGISSGNPIRLIDLVAAFEESTGYKLQIAWGSRSYRPREVMVPWTNYMTLPGWQPRVLFAKGIQQTFPAPHIFK
jgi:dTDP-4-dehydrorhamnose 3,5-epimerase